MTLVMKSIQTYFPQTCEDFDAISKEVGTVLLQTYLDW